MKDQLKGDFGGMDSRERLRNARLLFAEGRLQEAREVLQKLPTQEGLKREACELMVEVSEALSDFEGVQTWLQRLAEANLEFYREKAAKVIAHHAKEGSGQPLRMNEEWAAATVQLAEVQRKEGRAEQSLRTLEAAHAQQPQSTEILAKLCEAHLHNNPQKVIEYTNKLIAIQPQNSSLYLQCGHFAFKVKNCDAAILYLKKGLLLYPETASKFYLLWGEILVKCRQYKSSIPFLNKVTTAQSNNAKAFQLLFKAQIYLHDQKPAVSSLLRCIEFNPFNEYHQLIMACSRLTTEQQNCNLMEPFDIFQKYQERKDKKDNKCLRLLASFYQLAGYYSKARYICSKILESEQDDFQRAICLQMIGNCLYKLGDYELSTHFFEEALKIEKITYQKQLKMQICFNLIKQNRIGQTEALVLDYLQQVNGNQKFSYDQFLILMKLAYFLKLYSQMIELCQRYFQQKLNIEGFKSNPSFILKVQYMQAAHQIGLENLADEAFQSICDKKGTLQHLQLISNVFCQLISYCFERGQTEEGQQFLRMGENAIATLQNVYEPVSLEDFTIDIQKLRARLNQLQHIL